MDQWWASWILDTEQEREKKDKITRQILCPERPRACAGEEKQKVQEELQTMIENSAVSVKATTLATRSVIEFKIPDDISRMEAAANCWEPVSRKVLNRRGSNGSSRQRLVQCRAGRL